MAMEATEFAFPMDAEECEEGYDREYVADDFARYFRAFITSGIIADGGNIAEGLQVVANDDMTTTLKAGNLIIDGYRYELTKDLILQHKAADGVLDRIDRISITLDTAEREIHAILREGEYSYQPIAPQCRRTSEYMDYVVADVRIVKGAIKITQANITDTRLSTELCGIAFPFWRLDTGPFFAQLNSFYEEFVLKSDASYEDFLAWAEGKKTEFATWQKNEEDDLEDWEEEFKNKWDSWLLGETKGWQEEIIDWFNNLKEKLSENAAVQLQLQIGELNKLKTEEKENLVSAINSLCLSYNETMAILAGVKTVNVTLTANDGASLEGQSVTLLNVVRGEEVTKSYDADGISFEVFGNMEYSLSVNEMEDHVTPEDINILITEGDGLEVELEYKLKALNELPWSKIIEISENGNASEVFALHDEKEIELTTGEKIVVEIVDFDHDILAENTEKTAGITFGMKDCLATSYRMNQTNTNVGGWKESEMRTTSVRQHLYDVLPEDLKEEIKIVNKWTSAGNKSTTIETTADDVWLFSLQEMGITGLSTPYSQEGTTYPAYTNNSGRVKHGGIGGTTKNYFTRSPYVSNATQFRCISTSGGASYVNASTVYGMAIGFCV